MIVVLVLVVVTMMTMMIIITICALDILILGFLTCKWQLVWNLLIKFHISIIIIIINIIIIIVIIIIIIIIIDRVTRIRINRLDKKGTYSKMQKWAEEFEYASFIFLRPFTLMVKWPTVDRAHVWLHWGLRTLTLSSSIGQRVARVELFPG